MAKAILQSVGENTVAFNDQCYWVAENVKKFLNNFQPNMEVDVTVKDIDGTPMVTFLKKAGFPTQPAGQRPAPATPQGGQQYQAPRPPTPSAPFQAPPTGNQADAIYTLTAAIIVAYNLDAALVKSVASGLKY